MERARKREAAKLFCGMIAVDKAVMLEAEYDLATRFGAVDFRSPIIPFTFTDYYKPEMGEGLLRRFVSFAIPVDSACLAEIKCESNAIERRLAIPQGYRLSRRVNLDPGYVTAAKVVLATTKNRPHRIHLRDGIYAEVTLSLSRSGPECYPWTYPDYRVASYGEFFMAVRGILLAGQNHP
jgi:hypothetical protein